MTPRNIPLPAGLALRLSRPSDQGFLDSLYRTTREDLRLIDAEDDFIEELIDLQRRVQTVGCGDMFPNALYFILEYHGERVGRIVIDFGPNEARVVDISLIPAARGKGLRVQALRAIQAVAAEAMTPVTLVSRYDNPQARQLYLQLGFVVEEIQLPFAFMAWYPATPA